ncbi:hypothetical protein OROHE_003641 [Orobanche hederae]
MKSVVLRMIRKGYACHETIQTSSNGRSRGRGRGRGKGCGRGSQASHPESVDQHENLEDDPYFSNQGGKNQIEDIERLSVVADTTADSIITARKDADKPVVTFDLNVQLNEDGESTLVLVGAPSNSSEKPSPVTIHEDIHGWSFGNMERLAIDAVQLASLNDRMSEADEDYDEEG